MSLCIHLERCLGAWAEHCAWAHLSSEAWVFVAGQKCVVGAAALRYLVLEHVPSAASPLLWWWILLPREPLVEAVSVTCW